jgi:putative FmdB family regulatory protein
VPTYQYACTACGHQLEAVQAFSDDALTVCPACEGRLRKVFSAVGIVFKGSGFYRTDSRADKSGGSATPAKESTPTSETSSTPSAASTAGSGGSDGGSSSNGSSGSSNGNSAAASSSSSKSSSNSSSSASKTPAGSSA